jgi:hypothetical protein
MSNHAGGPVNPPLPDPAFPVVGMPLVSHGTFNSLGMSRRAFAACLAAAALAGAVGAGDTAFDPHQIAQTALAVADALLEGLDAPPARP